MSLHRWLLAPLLLAIAWFAPRIGDPWLSSFEKFAARFAKQRNKVLITVAITAILARLALLSILPVPVPETHDEFAHLLAGDTFAHGRLANPTPPFWIFFDTFHELMHPAYASIFAPANGGVLAIGELLGHPWIGVLLSMVLMCVALSWALQSWLPSEWALVGSVLVLLRIYLFSYWLEGYWGGAVSAIGGALVIGSVPHLMRRHEPRYSWLMGLGAFLLANSRPLEGFVFCLPVVGALILWMLSPRAPAAKLVITRVIMPCLSFLAVTLAFVGYYNWRVTGHALVMPEALYAEQYINYRILIWQALKPPLIYANPQFEQYFNTFFRESRHGWSSFWQAHSFWQFFLGPTLSLPLLMFPRLLLDRRVRLLLMQFLLCALGFLAVAVGFLPHYAGPVTATFFILLIQAMRHLRRVEIKGRPIGVFLTRLVVVLAVLRVAAYIRRPPSFQEPWARERAKLVESLQATPQRHLILVRYSANHNPHHEWVFNAAAIDRSRIVWARVIPGRDLNPLLDHFRDRTVWVVEADSPNPELRPYRDVP